ncbi:MAG: hypothetical protein IJG33_17900 [Selenomonadaceae bacterium]|nr:hypothetical protein [Selenomonadaceae bacterium]
MIKKCKLCGKKFETKTVSKFCSPECRYKHRYEYNKKYDREYKKRKYHSDPEYREKVLAHNAEWIANNKAHYAAYKHEWYLEQREEQYAREAIRYKLHWIDEGRNVKPFCSVCGKTFKPSSPTERFCSNKCRMRSPLWRIFLDSFRNNGRADVTYLD